MNNFDFCRKSLYNKMNIQEQDKRNHIQVQAEIKRMTNSLEKIVSLAKPRLIMGVFDMEVIGNMTH